MKRIERIMRIHGKDLAIHLWNKLKIQDINRVKIILVELSFKVLQEIKIRGNPNL